MKKLLTIAALIGATSLSFGQGYVAFNNTSGTRFSTNGVGAAAGTGFGTAALAGRYYFELFVAPSTQNAISSLTDPTLSGWTAVALGTNSTTAGNAGRLNGNTFDTAQGASIAGFAGGSTADFAVVGWSANIGATWAEAQTWWANGNSASPNRTVAGWFGINTAVADNIPLANAGGPYPPIFGTTGGLMTGWGLSYYPAIPEPSSFALAGLGAAAMLIFRRRKQ
jgi:hypothetical protein